MKYFQIICKDTTQFTLSQVDVPICAESDSVMYETSVEN